MMSPLDEVSLMKSVLMKNVLMKSVLMKSVLNGKPRRPFFGGEEEYEMDFKINREINMQPI